MAFLRSPEQVTFALGLGLSHCGNTSPPDGSASQAQNLPNSQVLWPDEAVCLRRKKRHSRPDPFARLSDLCHRQLPEDQTAILSSVEHDDPSHATLL
ncbi:hypothetical protein J1605_022560 [Eschrichtius robustus]|uniref:Uncharacterized protein n=1 Tax=Eschrichtius robustus TaxID=9764 RepID=A0AB34H940_ESCRO|nr:hypothetical protein J1605_022560 [Eschrichtius robustus]